MHFEIVGEVDKVEVIAVGRRIRQLKGLKEQYGKGRWRKLKGEAAVRLPDSSIRKAEVH